MAWTTEQKVPAGALASVVGWAEQRAFSLV
ncbi:hypothetical protein ABIE49_001154 [Bradyrhizobium sp. OAE829]